MDLGAHAFSSGLVYGAFTASEETLNEPSEHVDRSRSSTRRPRLSAPPALEREVARVRDVQGEDAQFRPQGRGGAAAAASYQAGSSPTAQGWVQVPGRNGHGPRLSW